MQSHVHRLYRFSFLYARYCIVVALSTLFNTIIVATVYTFSTIFTVPTVVTSTITSKSISLNGCLLLGLQQQIITPALFHGLSRPMAPTFLYPLALLALTVRSKTLA